MYAEDGGCEVRIELCGEDGACWIEMDMCLYSVDIVCGDILVRVVCVLRMCLVVLVVHTTSHPHVHPVHRPTCYAMSSPSWYANVDYATGEQTNSWIDSLSASFAGLQVS